MRLPQGYTKNKILESIKKKTNKIQNQHQICRRCIQPYNHSSVEVYCTQIIEPEFFRTELHVYCSHLKYFGS